MIRLAIFASGAGTNAEKILDHFRNNEKVDIPIIFSNSAKSGVLNVARNHNVDVEVINKDQFYSDEKHILGLLKSKKVDWIILAGFLWLIPKYLIDAYKGRIVNIHPSLLPKYGGKGMYGMHVHKAVIQAGEKESGITIHYVSKNYDEGAVIFQAKCPIELGEDAEKLAGKIKKLEHLYYPRIIKELVEIPGES